MYMVYAEITTLWGNIKSLFGSLEGLTFLTGSLIQSSFDGYIVLRKVTEICSIKRQKGLLDYLVSPTLCYKLLHSFLYPCTEPLVCVQLKHILRKSTMLDLRTSGGGKHHFCW